MNTNNYLPWIMWLAVTLAIAIFLGVRMTGDDGGKSVFLTGKTTHGHYQIEMACSACHKDSFGGKETLQSACLDCHASELKLVDDSHPKTKFTDPRNADRVKVLDARYCITCHQEHNDDVTNTMGLTLQNDYCYRCHQDVADDRPTHKDLPFDSCASAGCHNYHDNTALYEDYIEKHLHDQATRSTGKVRKRDLAAFIMAASPGTATRLLASDADMPPHLSGATQTANEWLESKSVTALWQASRHSQSGVNCRSCHKEMSNTREWVNKPGIKVCTECHENEAGGFLDGRHGMRVKQGLTEMSPALARLPMKTSSLDKHLNCNTCHTPHDYNPVKASYELCIGCHDDEHSKAYQGSAHAALWMKENEGEIENGTGVSCATCHMPREVITQDGVSRTLVQHNQNTNLRPNEKMIRSVCINCHGLEFSINALADDALIKRNFSGQPATNVKSIEWVRNRVLDRSNNSVNGTTSTKE
jgi:predicted CXXCH cytochrome family protein